MAPESAAQCKRMLVKGQTDQQHQGQNRKRSKMNVFNETMASPAGFEPATSSLEGCCSIQLSYGPFKETAGLNPPTR
jgi:hypothetical protein